MKNQHKKGTKLKINDRLPQIILPNTKIPMFADWWNTDIRFENTIPHSFEEGYLFIENINRSEMTVDKFKTVIKLTAKACHTTYRNIENEFKEYLESMTKFILHFKFLNASDVILYTYDNNYELVSVLNFSIGESGEPGKEINLDDMSDLDNCQSFDDVLNVFNMQNLGLFITCLWYIATTTRNTKYIYENKKPKIVKRHKDVVVVSDTKTIDTPIYDMRKIRVVKTEHLQNRKKGWTFSHAFQVHGHYRHYKSGKTIFIKPYIKGKDKDFKPQTITLSPKEVK